MNERSVAPDPPSNAAHEGLVRQVDALWADGPPARGVVVDVLLEGRRYFRVRALALTCEGCGTVVPQSRTRVSPGARRSWLLHHARCSDQTASP